MTVFTTISGHPQAPHASLSVSLPGDTQREARVRRLAAEGIEVRARTALGHDAAIARWRKLKPQIDRAAERADRASAAVRIARAKLALVEADPAASDDYLAAVAAAKAAIADAEAVERHAEADYGKIAAHAPGLWSAAAAIIVSAVTEARLAVSAEVRDRIEHLRGEITTAAKSLEKLLVQLADATFAGEHLYSGNVDYAAPLTAALIGAKPRATSPARMATV